MRTVSITLPDALDTELTRLAQVRRVSRSAVVREALEALSKRTAGSVTELAGPLVGCLRGPADLSTNADHLAGYGE